MPFSVHSCSLYIDNSKTNSVAITPFKELAPILSKSKHYSCQLIFLHPWVPFDFFSCAQKYKLLQLGLMENLMRSKLVSLSLSLYIYIYIYIYCTAKIYELSLNLFLLVILFSRSSLFFVDNRAQHFLVYSFNHFIS